jgi:hypothetical protein
LTTSLQKDNILLNGKKNQVFIKDRAKGDFMPKRNLFSKYLHLKIKNLKMEKNNSKKKSPLIKKDNYLILKKEQVMPNLFLQIK